MPLLKQASGDGFAARFIRRQFHAALLKAAHPSRRLGRERPGLLARTTAPCGFGLGSRKGLKIGRHGCDAVVAGQVQKVSVDL